MHRRKRIRLALMPSTMEIDGDGCIGTKLLTPSKQDHGSTSIETLNNQLQKISIKHLSDEQKKTKRPKYIDTSKLLNFTRSARPASTEHDTQK